MKFIKIRIKDLFQFGLVLVILQTFTAKCYAQKDANIAFINTVSDRSGHIPTGYVPPLISNGSLSMLIDYQGCQNQRQYVGMTPGIYWAGRRNEAPKGGLPSFGHFEQELRINGQIHKEPTSWKQTLNTKGGFVTCENNYGNMLKIETIAFTYLPYNVIAIKKRFTVESEAVHSVDYSFRYMFTSGSVLNNATNGNNENYTVVDEKNGLDISYQTNGQKNVSGLISLFADKDVETTKDSNSVALTSKIALDAKKPVEVTFYLLFEDGIDGSDYLGRSSEHKTDVLQMSFTGLLNSQQKNWNDYLNESYVRLPNDKLEKIYNTAQYHLRANATKWSFPVGIFPTHWAGRYFGWDEMFCFQALATSNHLAISRRVPEFRFAGLPTATRRVSHYNNPGKYGARYPWEVLEDGSDATPPGFWEDHVFHMSNIALSSWFQYQYSGDIPYLKTVGYPVIKECARFYITHMVYENTDGSLYIGKCTDLERLGPAKQNPFMTACGAIYTLEAAAEASNILLTDKEEAVHWKRVATKLRESLPREENRYVPIQGDKQKSVASLGGLFPYPIFEEQDTLQRNAAYDFLENAGDAGNMYPVGKGISPWYAGWIASAFALLHDKNVPEKLMTSAAEGAGLFNELFEINEPGLSVHPWFSTASGNYIYALNQMLLQCKENEIRIAPAVPKKWDKFSFKLSAHDNLVVQVEVKAGKIVNLSIIPGNQNITISKTIIIPSNMINIKNLNKHIVSNKVIKQDAYCLDIQFQGTTTLIGSK